MLVPSMPKTVSFVFIWFTGIVKSIRRMMSVNDLGRLDVCGLLKPGQDLRDWPQQRGEKISRDDAVIGLFIRKFEEDSKLSWQVHTDCSYL